MKKITLMFSLLSVCFCWKAHSQTPPANDDLANAIPLIMGASCTNDFFTNDGATAETDEPVASCFTGAAHTVWFSFTVPASGAVEITTDILPGDIKDTQIAIYPEPSDLSDLSTLPPEVGCDQDGGEIVSNGTSTYMSTLQIGGLTPGDTYYVQVDGWNGATGDFCIQVSKETCPDPSNLAVENITGSSAEISWTENGTSTTWDVEVVSSGATPTGTPTAEDVSMPYVLTGLIKNSFYEVYVRSDCGGGDVSGWVGPIGFNTSCVIFPFCENFDSTPTGGSSNPTIPVCWSFIDSGNGYGYVNSSYGQSFYIYNSSDTAGDYILVSPEISILAEGTPVQLTFDVNSSEGQDLIVGTMSNPSDASTFTPVQTFTMTTTDYETFTATIPAGSATYVGFKHGQNATYDSYYIDNICFSGNCLMPTGITSSNITTTSAEFDWTESNTPPAASWDVEIVPAGTSPTGAPTATGVSKPYTANGLNPSTDYVLYIRANCGGGDFSAYASFPFSTACATVLPYTEDFTTFLPNCWGQADSGSPSAGPSNPGNSSWTDDEFLNTGSNMSAKINLYTNSKEDWLISPAIDLSGGSYELVYTAAITDYANSNPPDGNGMGSDDEVQVLITSDGGSTWTNLKTYNQADYPSHTGDTEVIDLSTYTGTVKIAFWATEGSTDDSEDYDFFIDDFEVQTPPTCPQPNTLSAANITSTSADLGWTEAGTATTWDVHIVPAGDPAPTSTTTPTNPGETANPFTASNLSPITSYDFYVRADCGGGDLSAWTGPYTFTTTCAILVAPWSEGFAGNSTPNCWTESGANTWDYSLDADYAATNIGDHTPGGGTNYAWMDGSDNSGSDVSTLTSPLIDISTLTVPALQFYLFSNNTDDGAINIVDVEFYDGATWNNVLNLTTLLGTDWVRHTIDLSTYTITGNVQVRFTVTASSTGSTFYNDILIDDVSFMELPTCFAPSGLTATNITNTSADLGWTDTNTPAATTWDIEVVNAGTPPTGTPTHPGITSNPYTITGLSQCVSYEFYVRSSCGSGDSSAWVGPVAFSLTGSGVVTAPYTQDFENNGNIPNCWMQGASNSDDWIFDTTGGHVGNAGDFLGTTSASGGGLAYVDDSTPDDMGTTLVTPQVDVSGLTTPILSFYTISDNEGFTNVSFSVDFYDGASWNTAVYTSNSNTGGWIKVFVDLSAYTITGPVKARFIVDEDNAAGDFYDDRAIDDVSFMEAPTCLLPSGLSAGSITSSTAELSWTDGNTPPASLWDIEIVPTGTAPTGTPTATGVSNPYSATNLSPSTSYDFYVRSDCGGGDLSDWAGPYTFITACQTATLPYMQDFSSGIFPVCWSRSSTSDVTIEATCGSRSNVLRFDYAEQAITEPIDASGSGVFGLKVSYYIADSVCGDQADAGEIFSVDYWDGTQWVTAKTYDAARPDVYTYEFFIVPRSDLSNEFKVRFDQLTGSSVTTDSWFIDDLVVELPSCIPPSGITVSNIEDTSADISWTPEGSETEWKVEYGPTGFALGNGTVVMDSDGNPGITISDLAPETTYDVYVGAVCTDNTSMGGPESFTTAVLDCPDVTGISIINVTETSFEVTWTAGGAETIWKIEYGPVGFDPGTGTMVIDGDGIGEIIIGLDPNTEYEVYVTAICDGFDGTDIGPEAFDTIMGIEDQLFEDFSFYPNPVSGRLFLKASSKVQKVIIYDLLGQKVLETTPDRLKTSLELGNLQTGTYLMQVTIDGSKGVYKLIKE